MLSKIKCSTCGAENERNASHCCVDGASLGFPNVNILSDPYFKNALNDSYNKIKAEAKICTKQKNIKKFEKIINDKAQAVINLNIDFLFTLINENKNYLPYQKAVREGERIIAKYNNDKNRCCVESAFYGMIGGELIYAALSLNDSGLTSYGNTTIVLNNDTIKSRTTVFIKNSFKLFDELINKGWKITDTPPPSGFYGVWSEKSKIALIKHYNDLDCVDLLKIADIIMKNSGIRNDDEFIELHIYNSVNILNFKKIITLANISSDYDKIQMKILEEKLKKNNIDLSLV